MIKMRDYEGPNGRVDWESYRKAQKNAGELCSCCGSYILELGRPSPSGPRECGDCQDMTSDPDEVHHADLLRCPACGSRFRVDSEMGLYEAGFCDEPGSVYCPDCEHDFEVKVRVTFEYTSPPRIQESNDPEENPDE